MEATLGMLQQKIQYFRAREKRLEGQLRTENDFKSAEMRLDHTREILGELIQVQRILLTEIRETAEANA